MKANLHFGMWICVGLISASFSIKAQTAGASALNENPEVDYQYELLAGLNDDFNRENRIKPSKEADLFIKASRLSIDLAKEREIELSARTGWAKDFVWKFGDGKMTSGFQHVKHKYDRPGKYQITLLASNGDKVERQQIDVEVTDSSVPLELEEMEHYIVFPQDNKLEAHVQLNLPRNERNLRFQIQDVEGHEVVEFNLGRVRKHQVVDIDMKDLPDGKYYAVLKGKKFSLVSRLTVMR